MRWMADTESLTAWSTLAGAVATWLAAIAALLAGWYAFRSFQQLRSQTDAVHQQLDHSQEQAKATTRQLELALQRIDEAQAQAIQVWAETKLCPEEGTGLRQPVLELFALNSSSAPIFNLYVGVDLGKRGEPDIWYWCNHHLLAARGPGSAPLRLPIHERTYDDWREWAKRHPKNPHPRVEIQFADACGRRWRRESNGNLRLLEQVDPEAPEWVNKRRLARQVVRIR